MARDFHRENRTGSAPFSHRTALAERCNSDSSGVGAIDFGQRRSKLGVKPLPILVFHGLSLHHLVIGYFRSQTGQPPAGTHGATEGRQRPPQVVHARRAPDLAREAAGTAPAQPTIQPPVQMTITARSWPSANFKRQASGWRGGEFHAIQSWASPPRSRAESGAGGIRPARTGAGWKARRRRARPVRP